MVRMTTIDRLLTRMFLSSYFLLLLVGVGLYIFVAILINLDEFTEQRELSTGQMLLKIVDYHGYRLPLYFHQLGGLMMAIAAAFTFATLLRNNELTPLVAAGIPLQRLAAPVLACCVTLVGLWLVNSEVIVPALASKIVRVPDDIGRPRPIGVRHARDDRNAILTAAELDTDRGRLRRVHIIEPASADNAGSVISADEAIYDRAGSTWRLVNGQRLPLDSAFAGGDLGIPLDSEPLDAYAFGLTPEQIRLRQTSRWSDLMSIRQMTHLLAVRNLPNLPAVAKSRDVRFTQPLLMWILVMLTAPFFLTREPVNVLLAGGKALLLGGACFGLAFLAHSSSTADRYIQLAVWLPVFLFGPVAVLHLANMKT
jgi:lipopolysaccharide export LptBFGC system permease protein LptF